MSTRSQLDVLCQSGRLHKVAPRFQGHPIDRDVYVSENVREFIHGTNQRDKKLIALGAKAAAALDFFIRGKDVQFALDPHAKKPTAQLARVAPYQHCVFDVRVLDPNPGVRIFGCFAAKDCLVLLTWHLRDNLGSSIQFDQAALACRAKWFELFGRTDPLNGTHHDDFLSEPYTPC